LLLTFAAAKLVEAMLERGVIANAASGYVLRIVPPLIAGKTEVDEYVAVLRECLSEFNM